MEVKLSSLDLRQKIVDAINSGLTQEEVAARFGVSTDSVSRYHQPWRETGHLHPRPIPGPPPRITRDDDPALRALLDAHDNATFAEYCALRHEAGHVLVSQATRCRAQQKLDWTRNKSP